MKKLKISRASTAAFLVVVAALLSISNILTVLQITSASKREDVFRTDRIGTESSS